MYLTREEILNEISADTLALITSNDGSLIDWDKVDKAIQDASAVIDSYLSSRYSVPLSTVPRLIKKICSDLTIYELYQSAISNNYIAETPEGIKERHDKAMEILKDISAGKAGIEGLSETGEQITDPTTSKIRYTSRDKTFGDDFENKYG